MPAKVVEGFALSPQQKLLWSLSAEGAHRLPYRCCQWVRIEGGLDRGALRRTLERLVERHEILRTTLECLPEMTTPLQVIQAPSFDLEELELGGGADAEQRAGDLFEAQLQEPFAAERPGQLRFILLALTARENLLLVSLSGFCSDAATLDNLVREIGRSYASVVLDEELEEPLQYADLADWQNSLFEAEDAQPGVDYWRQLDLSLRVGQRLPFEKRTPVAEFEPRRARRSLPPELVDRLAKLARRSDTPLSSVLLSCWQVLLWRLTGCSPLLLGVAFENRDYEELEEVLGLLARTVPAIADPESGTRFDELLEHNREMLQEHQKWQECFSWQHFRELEAHQCFFPWSFAFEERAEGVSLGGLRLSCKDRYTCVDRFTLKLLGVRRGDGLDLELHYDASRIEAADVERLAHELESVLESAARRPRAMLGELAVLDEDERRALLIRFNDGAAPAAVAGGVHRLFERQVGQRGGEAAVVFEDRQLTYAELNERSNRLAHHLRRRGTGTGTLVALYLERSLDWVVGMMAVLKAGGAYLPLEVTLPADRLAFLLRDSRAPLVLSSRELAASLPEHAAAVVCPEEQELARESPGNPAAEVPGESLAYVIYTSGSTGRPKGVAVGHRQLLHYVQGLLTRLAPPAGSGFAAVSTFAADLGHTSVFGALCGGGCLHVLSQERATDAAAFGGYNRRHDVDYLKIVPSHLTALLDRDPAGAFLPRRKLVLGGEASLQGLVERLRGLNKDFRIVNHYGPTETTVGVLTYELAPDVWDSRWASVPLGRPLAGSRVYLLDRHLDPVPTWAAGELSIGGGGLARGYLGRPGWTAGRFIPDPWTAEPGARLYKTGDLARHVPDAGVEFLGRIDHQVKIRGFRVELGEIESALRSHPGVEEALVELRSSGAGEERLMAWVVTERRAAPAPAELRAFLRDRLPDYMVPAAFVELETLPLTANGKVDRQALPEPRRETLTAGDEALPRSQIEEVVVGIWAQLLDLPTVGVLDNFFELGGHSLLVTQVLARLREVFRVEIGLKIFFEDPTPTGLAENVRRVRQLGRNLALPDLRPVPRQGPVPLSFSQHRLWFYEQLEPGSAFYNIAGAARLRGSLDVEAMESALSEILRRHEILRTVFAARDGEPIQTVGAVRRQVLTIVDLETLPGPARAREAQRLAHRESLRPFDLGQGPLLRPTLLRLTGDEHVLLLTFHHIVGDGWSNVLLLEEAATLYGSFHSAKPSPLPELPLQYADFAVWQRDWLRGEILERHIAYWKRKLAGAPRRLELPTDYPRPPVQGLSGACEAVLLDASLSERLRALSRDQGVTLFMTLLAAFKVLLAYHTRQTDIVVGTNTANRTHLLTEPLIGFFVNQLVLLTSLRGDPEFGELLARVRDTALEAFDHQHLPFEKLVEELQPERDRSRSLLFQVKMEVQQARGGRLALPGLEAELVSPSSPMARYDLHLTLLDSERDVTGALLYDTDLFRAETIKRWLTQLEHLLNAIVEDPAARLSTLIRTIETVDKKQQTAAEDDFEDAVLGKLKERRSAGRRRSRSATPA